MPVNLGSPSWTAAECKFRDYGPTSEPTMDPTIDPTFDPTMEPTYNPTGDPTINPTTNAPTEPTSNPTLSPNHMMSTDMIMTTQIDDIITGHPTTNLTTDMVMTTQIETIIPEIAVNINIITNCIFVLVTILFVSVV